MVVSPRKGSLGLPAAANASSRMDDDTAQLSVADAGTGASTPRNITPAARSGSDETIDGRNGNGVPRSSTPPLTGSAHDAPHSRNDQHNTEDSALSRIDSRSSDVGEPTSTILADTSARSATIPIRDASLTSHYVSSSPPRPAAPLHSDLTPAPAIPSAQNIHISKASDSDTTTRSRRSRPFGSEDA